MRQHGAFPACPSVAALIVALLAGTPSFVASLAGQEATQPARVTGVVWDSLGGGPLAGAEVVLGEGLAASTTGPEGNFTLTAAPGRYPIAFSHAKIPDWALPPQPSRIEVAEGETVRLTLATRSPSTVLNALCDGHGTLVGGYVRDMLTLVPLSAAAVDVRMESDAGGSSTWTEHASGSGSWATCVAPPARLAVRARLGNERSRALAVLAEEGSVAVRDLFIQLSEPAQLQGVVRDAETGRPLVDAAVRIVGTRLGTFTREDGHFTFRGVAPGELEVAVELLGYGRRVAELRVEGGARVEMSLDLFPEAVALDSMVVSVRGATAERVRAGARYDGLDRPAIDALLPRSIGFDDLLRNANVPGLKIREAHFRSVGGVPTPGICIETSRTSTTYSDRCQMVEVYLNGVRMADPETFLLGFDPASVDSFRLLSRTEAGVQYGGTPRARNGVLLIYTRGR